MWDGALILTVEGQLPVEQIAPGTIIKTASGREKRVVAVHRRDGTAGAPTVRICVKALGDGHPYRVVDLPPDNLILIHDQLLAARRVVNGASITAGRRETETPPHALEIEADENADGEATQPYRPLFHADGFVHAEYAHSPEVWDRTASPATKQWLLDTAADLGFTATDDPELRIAAGDATVPPRSAKENRYIFSIPEGTAALRLVSRVWVPAQVMPESTDERHLGVCVRRLVVDGHEIDLETVEAGWDKLEDHGAVKPRWTKGSALVPCAGARSLDVELYGFRRYWVPPRLDVDGAN